MNDFVIDDAAVHFAASKNVEYRRRVKERFLTFIDFLEENGLTTQRLLAAGETPSDEFKLMRSHLTAEGFEVVKAAYDRWFRGIDKGKPISDTTILQNALLQVRN